MANNTIRFNEEAASLEIAFNEYMEAKRAQVVENNGSVEMTMQVLENIIGSRHVLNNVAMDKTLRWLMLSGNDEKDMKRITDLAMRKGRGDSSSTCLLQSAMIQAEREAVFEVHDMASRYMAWKQIEAKRAAK